MTGALLWWLVWAAAYGVGLLIAQKLLRARRFRSKWFRISCPVLTTAALWSSTQSENDVYVLVVVGLTGWALSIVFMAFFSIITAVVIPLTVASACLPRLSLPPPWGADSMFEAASIGLFFLLHAWVWSIALDRIQHRGVISIGAANADRKPQPF